MTSYVASNGFSLVFVVWSIYFLDCYHFSSDYALIFYCIRFTASPGKSIPIVATDQGTGPLPPRPGLRWSSWGSQGTHLHRFIHNSMNFFSRAAHPETPQSCSVFFQVWPFYSVFASRLSTCFSPCFPLQINASLFSWSLRRSTRHMMNTKATKPTDQHRRI